MNTVNLNSQRSRLLSGTTRGRFFAVTFVRRLTYLKGRSNGNGEMTGTTWVEKSGFLGGPVMITNTHSVGVVRDAVIQWTVTHRTVGPDDDWWSLPVVAETWDGWLNDINGFHVKPEHAFHAIDSAHGGAVEEGAVGGGTGMICNGFKGGIGTSSRKLAAADGGYTIGVLVQCNYGRRQNFSWRVSRLAARYPMVIPTPLCHRMLPNAARSLLLWPRMRHCFRTN